MPTLRKVDTGILDYYRVIHCTERTQTNPPVCFDLKKGWNVTSKDNTMHVTHSRYISLYSIRVWLVCYICLFQQITKYVSVNISHWKYASSLPFILLWCLSSVALGMPVAPPELDYIKTQQLAWVWSVLLDFEEDSQTSFTLIQWKVFKVLKLKITDYQHDYNIR